MPYERMPAKVHVVRTGKLHESIARLEVVTIDGWIRRRDRIWLQCIFSSERTHVLFEQLAIR
jgi:hypothetical protein